MTALIKPTHPYEQNKLNDLDFCKCGKAKELHMKIPQEIQDLMPERKEWNQVTGREGRIAVDGFNQALTEVEAVLPQIIALAEKRGAEEMLNKLTSQSLHAEVIFEVLGPGHHYSTMPVVAGIVSRLKEKLTQPNHE